MAPAPPIHEAIARFTTRQHGLVLGSQLRDAGLTSTQVSRAVHKGVLRRLRDDLYMSTAAPYTWHSRLAAACLASDGLASHRSAAVLYGIPGFRPGPPEITVPRGHRYRQPGTRVHTSTVFHLADARRISGIPVTGPDRLIFDLAGVIGADALAAAVDDLLVQRRVNLDGVATMFLHHARRGRRGTAALRELLNGRLADTGTAESELERRFLRLARAHGFPPLTMQYEIHDEDGFVMRTDAALPAAMTCWELDSRQHHLTERAFQDDRRKRRRARRAGWVVHEYTNEVLSKRVGDILVDLAEALERAHALAQLVTHRTHGCN